MNKITAVLATVIAVSTPAAAAQDCLAYLATDVAFHDAAAEPWQIDQAVMDAFTAFDHRAAEAILENLEARDGGRWKAYAAAARAEARFRADNETLLHPDRRAEADRRYDQISRDLARATAAGIGAPDLVQAAEREVEYLSRQLEALEASRANLIAVNAAWRDAWAPAARGQLVAAYAEAYAAGGRDVEGFDIEAVFPLAAQERRAACPPVRNPELPEPLEFLARY